MGPFALLEAAASASETMDEAREFIRGGQMTDIFEQMGDVHLNSAIEHVRQAEHSLSSAADGGSGARAGAMVQVSGLVGGDTGQIP